MINQIERKIELGKQLGINQWYKKDIGITGILMLFRRKEISIMFMNLLLLLFL